jgi:hypothetical protein
MSEDLTPYRIEPIALSNESTVVAEFLADGVRETVYQSEAELEKTRTRDRLRKSRISGWLWTT